MLLKVSSFHVYTHQDKILDTVENCTICDFAIQNQNAEFIFTSIFIIISLPVLYVGLKLSFVSIAETPSQFLRLKFFGRPPPMVC